MELNLSADNFKNAVFIIRVKTFAEPVNKFKENVTATEVRMEKLRNNLEDLRSHSDNAQQMVILFTITLTLDNAKLFLFKLFQF
jgi:hypothetical protein